MARKIILRSFLSPGDICTLTSAIHSLHAAYPARFITDIRTSCDEIFANNPRITSLPEEESGLLDLNYPLIHSSSSVPNAFLQGYCQDLGRKLDIPLELRTNRPQLFVTQNERATCESLLSKHRIPREFWLMTAGTKSDFTLKQWPIEYYQAVVDHFRGRLQFVQIGAGEHDHVPIEGTINLVGKTSLRELIALSEVSAGGVGPITLLQHLCAAFEKPYVAILGGREPVNWVQYPLQTTLHTIGRMDCCRSSACWRSRVVPLGDGSSADASLCSKPNVAMIRPVGQCMANILPIDVIRAIEMGGDF